MADEVWDEFNSQEAERRRAEVATRWTDLRDHMMAVAEEAFALRTGLARAAAESLLKRAFGAGILIGMEQMAQIVGPYLGDEAARAEFRQAAMDLATAFDEDYPTGA